MHRTQECQEGWAASKVVPGTSAARLLGLHSAALPSVSRLFPPLHHSLFSARYIPRVLCFSASQLLRILSFRRCPHGGPSSISLTQGLSNSTSLC